MTRSALKNSDAGRLRVGVVVDRDTLLAWERELITRLRTLDHVDLVWVARAPTLEQPRLASRAWTAAHRIDRAVSHRLFHRSFRRAGRDSDAASPLREAVGDVTLVDRTGVFDAGVRTTPEGDLLGADAVIDISDTSGQFPLGLDVRIGVLRLSFGQVSSITGRADASEEVLGDEPHTTCTLLFYPSDGTVVRGLARAHRTYLQSWSENLRRLHWGGLMLVLDGVRDLAVRGPRSDIARAPVVRPAVHRPTDSRAGRSAAKSLATVMLRTGTAVFHRKTLHDQWRILLRKGFGSLGDIRDYPQWEHIVPPPDRMWADPFVVSRDDADYIFVEEVELSTNKGVIVCLRRDAKGTERLGVVIEEPFHLSYPFLLEFDGELYMLPESSADRRTYLWKCESFPMKWEKKLTKFAGLSIVDSTIFQHNGSWWLFGTIDRVGAGILTSELHVYYSDNPIDGSWQPHPLNPVLVDDRCARMAGTVKVIDGRLVRFSQGSGRRYGDSLHMRHIRHLSRSDYVEEPIDTVLPAARQGCIGLHHFSMSGQTAVVDACYFIPRPGPAGLLSWMALPRSAKRSTAGKPRRLQNI